MTDNNEKKEVRQQEILDRFTRQLNQVYRRFFQHVIKHARYKERLAEEYKRIDAITAYENQEAVEKGLIDEDKAETLLKSAKYRHRRHIRRVLADDEDLEPHPIKIAITLPPGIGKTHLMKNAFNLIRPQSVDFYLPTNKLIKEHVKPEERSSDLSMDMPRNMIDVHYDKVDRSLLKDEQLELEKEAADKGFGGLNFNCLKLRKTESLGEAMLPIKASICARCEFGKKDSGLCGYMRQEDDLNKVREKKGMLVRTHNRLFTGSLIDRSDVKIIDESPSNACTEVHGITDNKFKIGNFMNAIRMHEDNEHARQSFEWMIDCCRYNKDNVGNFVKNIDDFQFTLEIINKVIRMETKDLHANETTKEILDKDIVKKQLKNLNILKIIFEHIIAYYPNLPLQTVEWNKTHVLVTHIHKPDIKKSDNVLIMDASFREETAPYFYGDDDYEMPFGSAGTFASDMNVLIQHWNRRGTAAELVGIGVAESIMDAQRKRREIIEAAKEFMPGRVLLTANKRVKEAFLADGLPEGWDAAHFGTLRGRNEWETFDGVLVVGQPLPHTGVVEREAAARDVLTGSPTGIEMIADDLKSLLPINDDGDYFHPDPRVWTLIQEKVHDEYVQAIGRVRSIRHEVPKKAMIVSNFMPEELINLVYSNARSVGFEKLNLMEKYICSDFSKYGFEIESYNLAATKTNGNRGSLRKRLVSLDDEKINLLLRKIINIVNSGGENEKNNLEENLKY